MPARASFVSGLYPHNQRMWANASSLPADDETFFHHLKKAGCYAAHIGKSHYYVHGGDRLRDHEPYMHARGLDYVHETAGPWATVNADSRLTDHRPGLGLPALLYSGMGNAAMPWTGSLGRLLAARLLRVVGDGASMVFQSVIIANLFHRRRVGGYLGLFATIGNVGSFAGAFASGFIPGNADPFFVAGVLAFVGIALFVAFGKPLWQPGPEPAGS